MAGETASEKKVAKEVEEVEKQLKQLAHLYYKINNTVGGLKQMSWALYEQGVPVDRIDAFIKELEEKKEQIKEEIEEVAEMHPVVPYLTKIRGVSVCYAGILIGIVPARKFDSIAGLWTHCGVAPPEYYRERFNNPNKYNKKAKWVAYVIGQSLIRAKGWYYEQYRKFREEEERKAKMTAEERIRYFFREIVGLNADDLIEKVVEAYRNGGNVLDTLKKLGLGNYYVHLMRFVNSEPPRSRAHLYLRALRKVVKMFLSHYYEIYHRVLGLPYKKPYIVEYGFRKLYHPPMVDRNKNWRPMFNDA
ncbi:MAG: hypothetical protein J7K15_10245 [Deltaproteobacteria bacterium]|nr:hypothetical protein [Deltaproteobacteria bacterium]